MFKDNFTNVNIVVSLIIFVTIEKISKISCKIILQLNSCLNERTSNSISGTVLYFLIFILHLFIFIFTNVHILWYSYIVVMTLNFIYKFIYREDI